MRELQCDVLIVGGGTGGTAAALAATSLGHTVILTEETDWVGGQLTSQAVPPDEHPWIEQFGCTARYRAYRDGVRAYYRDHTPLLPEFRTNPRLNPGTGWVSHLCHEPRIGWQVLNQMLLPALSSGRLTLLLNTFPTSVETSGDHVGSVTLQNLAGETTSVRAKYVLDATELGDLLPMSGTEYVVGAESRSDTGEPNAVDGPAEPDNLQGITWCFALAHDEGSHRTIDRPDNYDFWRTFQPSFWPGPIFGYKVVHAHTLEARELPLFSDHWYALFPYRQIVEPRHFAPGYHPHPVTIVNWPMNDFYLRSPTPEPVELTEGLALRAHAQAVYAEAKNQSECVLYWLQTEAPRHEGGVGYPGLYTRPDIMGTDDGYAKFPYIREARRLKARFTVLEDHVAAYTNPDQDRARTFSDSVGIGAYRIDLHPSTNGANTIDTSTLPFQIPLGALIPVRMRNLLPAAKNLGVTHVTNGCYRLHPVEWNIGESAGLLAVFCLQTQTEPQSVADSEDLTRQYQSLLRAQGIELEWPMLRAL